MIYWPNKLSNHEPQKKYCVLTVSLEVKQCRWRWIGHICRMPLIVIPQVVYAGLQMEKRKRGRIKEKWRRSVLVERELKEKGRSWRELVKLVKDKKHWLSLTGGNLDVRTCMQEED